MAAETSRPSLFDSITGKNLCPSLPLSQSDSSDQGGLRRRLSSLSLRIHPISASCSAFRRSKSMSAVGEFAGSSIKKWWDWGLGWILSRKPTFARDLEMNEEEKEMLGFHSRGSWRHVFYKLRSELRKLVGPGHLPITHKFRYDSFSYAQNFDEGKHYQS